MKRLVLILLIAFCCLAPQISGATGYWLVAPAVDPTWCTSAGVPIAAVKPGHYWDFIYNGTYADVGTIGGLNLTAEGSGNSFSSGLVLNGSGYAQAANNADLCDLSGGTWSLFIDLIQTTTTGWQGLFGSTDVSSMGYLMLVDYIDEIIAFYSWQPTQVYTGTTSVPLPAGRNILIVTMSGGTQTMYLNGTSIATASQLPPVASTQPFTIGWGNAGNFIGTVRRMGVLKNHCWSQAEVTAIQGLP